MCSHSWLAAPRVERRRMARRGLAACAVALAVAAAAAAPAETEGLTLAEAVSRALADGTAARIAQLEAERAEDAYGEARGEYLPQLAVTSNAGWSNRYGDSFVAACPNLAPGCTVKLGLATLGTDRGWLNVYLSQILFDLRRWRLIEREELAAEAAGLKQTRERDDVAYEVTRRYAELLRLRRHSAAAQERLLEAQWLGEQAELLFEAGRALEAERSLVELHREQSQLELRASQQESAVARQELRLAIGAGAEPAAPLRLVPESLPGADAGAPPAQAVEAVAGAPELRLLDLRRRMEELAASAARAGRLPTLKLVSGYSNYGPKRFDNFEDEIWVGVDLEVPLFDGLRSRHAIRGAERRVEIARLRHRSMLEAKRARVRELVQRLETNRQRLALAERRDELARQQQRIADLNLQAGRGDLGLALGAREQLGLRSRDAIDAAFRQVELWARLQRELGRLADAILGAGGGSPAGERGTANPARAAR